MSFLVDSEISRFKARARRAPDPRSPLEHAQWNYFVSLLRMMDMAMEDAGVSATVRQEVISKAMYGAPNHAEVEMNERYQQAIVLGGIESFDQDQLDKVASDKPRLIRDGIKWAKP